MNPRELLCITGPTASGKGALSLELARRRGAVVLSCDSMKVYRGIDVAAAKPTAEACSGVDVRLMDLCDPWEAYNASRYVADAETVLREADAAGRPALLCGGTSLYLKALTEGLVQGPAADRDLRARLEAEAAEQGSGALHQRLARLDPEAANRIHENDLRRIVRALEVVELTGEPLSGRQSHFGRPRTDLKRRLLVLGRERDDLARRINQRVDHMFDSGLVAECERLVAGPQLPQREVCQALGTREVLGWIEAGSRAADLDGVREKIKTNTRRFARRQLTWLRGHFPDARWLELGVVTSMEELADRVLADHGGLLEGR